MTLSVFPAYVWTDCVILALFLQLRLTREQLSLYLCICWSQPSYPDLPNVAHKAKVWVHIVACVCSRCFERSVCVWLSSMPPMNMRSKRTSQDGVIRIRQWSDLTLPEYYDLLAWWYTCRITSASTNCYCFLQYWYGRDRWIWCIHISLQKHNEEQSNGSHAYLLTLCMPMLSMHTWNLVLWLRRGDDCFTLLSFTEKRISELCQPWITGRDARKAKAARSAPLTGRQMSSRPDELHILFQSKRTRVEDPQGFGDWISCEENRQSVQQEDNC